MAIAANVEQAIHKSKRTVCVVSHNFVTSPICLSEFDTARSFDIAYHKHRLIVILFPDLQVCDMPDNIKVYVKKFTYLKRNSPMFMKRLMYRLAQNKQGEVEEVDDLGITVIEDCFLTSSCIRLKVTAFLELVTKT